MKMNLDVENWIADLTTYYVEDCGMTLGEDLIIDRTYENGLLVGVEFRDANNHYDGRIPECCYGWVDGVYYPWR